MKFYAWLLNPIQKYFCFQYKKTTTKFLRLYNKNLKNNLFCFFIHFFILQKLKKNGITKKIKILKCLISKKIKSTLIKKLKIKKGRKRKHRNQRERITFKLTTPIQRQEIRLIFLDRSQSANFFPHKKHLQSKRNSDVWVFNGPQHNKRKAKRSLKIKQHRPSGFNRRLELIRENNFMQHFPKLRN